MGDFGVKISKAGQTVFHTDERNMNLWSKYQVLKVVASGGGTFASSAANHTLTINHGLGYNPMVMFFKEMTTAPTQDLGTGTVRADHDGTNGGWIQNLASDLNNIYVTFGYPVSGSDNYDYYYYLFYDQGINS